MLAALLLLATAAATTPHPAALAGLYNGGQTELAATLMLRPDGHFGYALRYGALDEEAAGIWEADGDTVRLTTQPPVVPPRFVVERDAPDIMGGLSLRLADPPRLRGHSLDVLLFYAPDEAPIASKVAADGRVVLPDSRRPNALLPLLPGQPPAGEPILLTGKSGHRLTVRFEPNDSGKADFRGEPLAIDGDTLILPRFGRTLRFRRAR
jgi:hypothetical protein